MNEVVTTITATRSRLESSSLCYDDEISVDNKIASITSRNSGICTTTSVTQQQQQQQCEEKMMVLTKTGSGTTRDVGTNNTVKGGGEQKTLRPIRRMTSLPNMSRKRGTKKTTTILPSDLLNQTISSVGNASTSHASIVVSEPSPHPKPIQRKKWAITRTTTKSSKTAYNCNNMNNNKNNLVFMQQKLQRRNFPLARSKSEPSPIKELRSSIIDRCNTIRPGDEVVLQTLAAASPELFVENDNNNNSNKNCCEEEQEQEKKNDAGGRKENDIVKVTEETNHAARTTTEKKDSVQNLVKPQKSLLFHHGLMPDNNSNKRSGSRERSKVKVRIDHLLSPRKQDAVQSKIPDRTTTTTITVTKTATPKPTILSKKQKTFSSLSSVGGIEKQSSRSIMRLGKKESSSKSSRSGVHGGDKERTSKSKKQKMMSSLAIVDRRIRRSRQKQRQRERSTCNRRTKFQSRMSSFFSNLNSTCSMTMFFDESDLTNNDDNTMMDNNNEKEPEEVEKLKSQLLLIKGEKESSLPLPSQKEEQEDEKKKAEPKKKNNDKLLRRSSSSSRSINTRVVHQSAPLPSLGSTTSTTAKATSPRLSDNTSFKLQHSMSESAIQLFAEGNRENHNKNSNHNHIRRKSYPGGEKGSQKLDELPTVVPPEDDGADDIEKVIQQYRSNSLTLTERTSQQEQQQQKQENQQGQQRPPLLSNNSLGGGTRRTAVVDKNIIAKKRSSIIALNRQSLKIVQVCSTNALKKTGESKSRSSSNNKSKTPTRHLLLVSGRRRCNEQRRGLRRSIIESRHDNTNTNNSNPFSTSSMVTTKRKNLMKNPIRGRSNTRRTLLNQSKRFILSANNSKNHNSTHRERLRQKREQIKQDSKKKNGVTAMGVATAVSTRAHRHLTLSESSSSSSSVRRHERLRQKRKQIRQNLKAQIGMVVPAGIHVGRKE